MGKGNRNRPASASGSVNDVRPKPPVLCLWAPCMCRVSFLGRS